MNTRLHRRLYSIDALRGGAALAVVLFHAIFIERGYIITQASGATGLGRVPGVLDAAMKLFLSYGFTGVFLFFVISGFCIHLRWTKAQVSGGQGDLGFISFWKRRFRRLYPAYLAALTIYLVVRYMNYQLTLSWFTAWDVGLHLFMLHNIDYRTVYSLNGVFWTLAIEEQLYLAYFLLLIIRDRVGWVRTLALLLAGRLFVFIAGALLRIAFNVYTPINEAALSNWFIWALGAVSVEAAFGLLTLPAWCRKLRIGLLFLLVAGTLDYIDRLVDLHGAAHLLLITVITPVWGIGFFMILNRIVASETGWRALGRVPAIVRTFAAIGIFSYSLYLTHGLIQRQFIFFIPFLRAMPEEKMVWIRLLILSPLTIAFAWMFYRVFEKPFLAPPAYRAPAAGLADNPSAAADVG